jgi:hypothetical protein
MQLDLAPRYRIAIHLQKLVGHVNYPWFGLLFKLLLTGVCGYRCRELSTLRAKVRDFYARHPNKPVLICSNHLTMIDSMLINLFLVDPLTYLFRFRLFSWNVPELANFGKSLWLRLMCYLGKCVFVERKGPIASRKLTMSKMLYLLKSQQILTVFPEGGRSRSGLVDLENLVYGAGQLVQEIPGCQVLCVYLRGESQDSYSFFPRRRETFVMDAKPFTPDQESLASGRKGAKSITIAIMSEIKKMENSFIANRK